MGIGDLFPGRLLSDCKSTEKTLDVFKRNSCKTVLAIRNPSLKECKCQIDFNSLLELRAQCWGGRELGQHTSAGQTVREGWSCPGGWGVQSKR